MFYTLSSRLLVPPNTIFVADHTTGYFVNVLPDWLIVILSLECYIVICIDWLYVCFTALCFSHVEVRFDISVIKELIDWLMRWIRGQWTWWVWWWACMSSVLMYASSGRQCLWCWDVVLSWSQFVQVGILLLHLCYVFRHLCLTSLLSYRPVCLVWSM